MNEKRFKKLLNEYLDGALSEADLNAFKAALAESARYRNLLRQYQCLQGAQIRAFRANPRLQIENFSPGRLFRSAAIFANASVLCLTLGVFHASEPFALYSLSKNSTANDTAASRAFDAGNAHETPFQSSTAAFFDTKNDTAEMTAETAAAAPLTNGTVHNLLSDEYGFAIL